MRLTGAKLSQRLKSAKSVLTRESHKSFGKGTMDLKNSRYIADSGKWCLQYHYNKDTAIDGDVTIQKL